MSADWFPFIVLCFIVASFCAIPVALDYLGHPEYVEDER